jgi:hypothetical protein
MGTRNAIPEISLNTRDFSSVRLPTQCMTYLQRCYRPKVLALYIRMSSDEFNWLAVPYLRQLEVAFSPRSLGFNPRWLYLRYAMIEVSRKQVYFRISSVSLCWSSLYRCFVYHHSLRCTRALIRQHSITSSVCKLRASLGWLQSKGVGFLAYFPYFEEIKVGLWDHHAVCVSPHINFRIPEQFFMKFGMYIMTPEPASTTYCINPSRQSVCLYVYPHTVARQRLGKNVTASSNTHATIEELLDASFPMQSVSYRRKMGE